MTDISGIDPVELVHLVTWYASSQGDRLTTIRLVKFLYLLDLYYARLREGTTLTGWPWAFVYYGPYCQEVMEAIEAAARTSCVCSEKRASRYEADEYTLYWCDGREEPAITATLPQAVLGDLKAAIRRWGNNTQGLLDHVYFETEPMQAARRGARLDFSTARPVPSSVPIGLSRLSPEQLSAARAALARMRSRTGETPLPRGSRPIFDSAYEETVRLLDDEDLAGEAKGQAELGDLD